MYNQDAPILDCGHKDRLQWSRDGQDLCIDCLDVEVPKFAGMHAPFCDYCEKAWIHKTYGHLALCEECAAGPSNAEVKIKVAGGEPHSYRSSRP